MIKDRIREKRKALGLKQKELAKLIGVSAGNVSHWEQGITSPKGTNLLKLADVLKVSPDWLAGDSMNDSQPIKSVRNAWELSDDVDLSNAEYRDIMVPRLDEVSKDNYLGEANYNKLFPVRKELLQLYSLQPRHLGALVMPDTSMEPSIAKGDMLLVDTSVKTIERDKQRIYALVKDKTKLVICRADEDVFGKLMWVDSRGRQSATTVKDEEWVQFTIAGRVVMRTGAL